MIAVNIIPKNKTFLAIGCDNVGIRSRRVMIETNDLKTFWEVVNKGCCVINNNIQLIPVNIYIH